MRRPRTPTKKMAICGTQYVGVGPSGAPLRLTDNIQLMMLRTNIPDHIRRPISEEVVSVIHAPPSFQNWVWLMPYLPWCERHVDSILLPEVKRCCLEVYLGERRQRGQHERG
jgi:hypothetical protein